MLISHVRNAHLETHGFQWTVKGLKTAISKVIKAVREK